MKLISEASAEKLRGGFYTPPEIADFILRWGVNGSTSSEILEPSCGDGVFLKQTKLLGLKFKEFVGVEYDKAESKKARAVELDHSVVYNDDFHHFCNTINRKFDLIIGNPPYIRYQFFSEEQQAAAEEIFDKAGLIYSRLTNAWVSFVVGSSLLLKDKGKIGFVVPAEILQVSFAAQLRKFLAEFYNKINIISFEKLVFPNIQQEVVLLMCERNESQEHKIQHIELRDANDLQRLDLNVLKTPNKRIDFNSNKWTFYFLDQTEIDFLETVANEKLIPTLGEFARVEVGITTGSNDFFTVPLSTVEEYDLFKYAKPMVGRSVQVNSVIFNERDWRQNQASNARAHLLVFPSNSIRNGASRYIAFGEKLGVNNGYKTSIREDWFVVPSLKISDALFIRRNNLYPRLIVNNANAYSTDTMHRVFTHRNTDLKAFTASYYNSLSLAFAEVSGRSHGGGVLELMPNETERILLPYKEDHKKLLGFIDKQIRNRIHIDKILEVTNEVILVENYGLSKSEVKLANNIWKKLSKRRLNRGKKNSKANDKG